MLNIVDFSVYKREPLTIRSLTGEEFNIDGNFSTEFYLYLYDAYNKLQAFQKDDYSKFIGLLKEVALEILKLDKNKSPTMNTIDQQFNDFRVLQVLINKTLEYANEITNDPNSNSPTSN